MCRTWKPSGHALPGHAQLHIIVCSPNPLPINWGNRIGLNLIGLKFGGASYTYRGLTTWSVMEEEVCCWILNTRGPTTHTCNVECQIIQSLDVINKEWQRMVSVNLPWPIIIPMHMVPSAQWAFLMTCVISHLQNPNNAYNSTPVVGVCECRCDYLSVLCVIRSRLLSRELQSKWSPV